MLKDFFAPLTDSELVAQAAAKRASNPKYKPSLQELRAIDRVLIERYRQRQAA